MRSPLFFRSSKPFCVSIAPQVNVTAGESIPEFICILFEALDVFMRLSWMNLCPKHILRPRSEKRWAYINLLVVLYIFIDLILNITANFSLEFIIPVRPFLFILINPILRREVRGFFRPPPFPFFFEFRLFFGGNYFLFFFSRDPRVSRKWSHISKASSDAYKRLFSLPFAQVACLIRSIYEILPIFRLYFLVVFFTAICAMLLFGDTEKMDRIGSDSFLDEIVGDNYWFILRSVITMFVFVSSAENYPNGSSLSLSFSFGACRTGVHQKLNSCLRGNPSIFAVGTFIFHSDRFRWIIHFNGDDNGYFRRCFHKKRSSK